jgi:hypothetical protein
MSKTEVSGGTIWVPKQPKSFTPVPKTLEELKQERYKDLIDRRIPKGALIISIAIYAVMIVFNIFQSYSEAPTNEYFPLAKVPFLTSGTDGQELSITLIAISIFFLIISCLFFSRASNAEFVESIAMVGLMFLAVTVITSNLIISTGPAKVDNWLQETHGLTVETSNIPYEDGIIDKDFVATDKQGNKVHLTLEIKDLNLYILKQEIIKKD